MSVVSIELASVLIEVGYAHVRHGRRIPDHVIADLQLVVGSDLPPHMRFEAQRLIRRHEKQTNIHEAGATR